jgi:hypothetical protein
VSIEPAAAAADHLEDLIAQAIEYTKSRKSSFMRKSTVVRVTALVMSGASTVILGLQDLDFWASLGFVLVALSTVASGVEAFFNWRSRWVFAEEAQARFYQLQDELRMLRLTKPGAELTQTDVLKVFGTYEATWTQFSRQWADERKRGGGTS